VQPGIPVKVLALKPQVLLFGFTFWPVAFIQVMNMPAAKDRKSVV
jgi:hypothetical protein